MKPVSQQFEDHSAQNLANALTRTLNAFAYLLEAIMHKNMGLRYVDACAPFALLILIFYPIFWPGHDLRAYTVFAGLFLIAHIGQRVRAWRRRINGDLCHSYYSGEARLGRYFPRMSERTLKRHVEPILMLVVGGVALHFDRPLGTLLTVSAFAMIITNEQQVRRERERVYAMHDAVLENQMAADRFRGWYGNGN